MRSRRLAVTLVLGGIVACGGDGGSSGCVPTASASCNGGGGGGTTGFVTKSLTDGGTTYGYQVFIPANYNTTSGPIPVIVFMHGSVEKGSDNQAQTNVGLGPVVKANASSFPAIVVFPQGPAIEGTVGNEIFDRITVSALDRTLAEYSKADPKRVYLTGISYGGIRGYEVAYRNPTKFAAWVPISASICAPCISGPTSTTQTQGFTARRAGAEARPHLGVPRRQRPPDLRERLVRDQDGVHEQWGSVPAHGGLGRPHHLGRRLREPRSLDVGLPEDALTR